ncbi:MAG: TIGR01777 family oxidoreductase [Porticoccaceae bacterium]
MSTILITGGSGFIGRHLCRQLCADGRRVIVLTRNADAAKTRLGNDLMLIESLDELPQDLMIDVVINLAGEPLGEGRWTAARKALFYASRIGTTEQLHQFFVARAQLPKVLITGSAIGFYGAGSGDIAIDETAGSDDNFSYQLCNQWEQSASKFEAMGSRVVYLRTGIVLGQEGALAKMLLAFKYALGGSMGDGRQWMSWIHIDDMVALILYCLSNNAIIGAVNATAPNPVQNKEFASTLAATLRRPAFIPMPSFVVRLLFGQMGDELLLQGKKVIPRKVQDSGFNFQYPFLKSALIDVLTTK